MSEHTSVELLPAAAPEVRTATLGLDQLTGFEHAQPDRKLVELIRRLGVLQPIVVAETGDGRYAVVEGRRRAKAVQQLAGEGSIEPEIETVIVSGAGTERSAVLAALALALHASRGSSPASELRAIEAILETDRAAGEASSIKKVAAQTTMSEQTVRRRLRLRSLSPTLRARFDRGEIPASVAEAAARLTAEQQAQLEQAPVADGRLRLAAVRDVARQRTLQATLALPDGLFAEHESPWRLTVRGHLQAAIDAIPAGEENGPVAGMVRRALADAGGPARPEHTESEDDGRLLQELERTGDWLRRQGCGDGAIAVRAAVAKLNRRDGVPSQPTTEKEARR